MILAALAVAVYAGVAADTALRARSVAPVVGALGGFGTLMLVYVLWRREEELLAWSLLVLGIAYAVLLAVHGGGIDGGVPLVGAGLLLCGELATWSLDERWAIRAETAVVLQRAVAVAILALAGIGAAGLVVALAAAPVGGGLVWTMVGAASIVAVIGLVARLART